MVESLIIVKKSIGDLRICLDLTDLNKYVVRLAYSSNNLDKVNFKLKNAKHFSVFDATKGFFYLPLNDKSKLLTTMLTRVVVYVFNVLPVTLSNANDLIESALWELLKGLLELSTLQIIY